MCRCQAICPNKSATALRSYQKQSLKPFISVHTVSFNINAWKFNRKVWEYHGPVSLSSVLLNKPLLNKPLKVCLCTTETSFSIVEEKHARQRVERRLYSISHTSRSLITNGFCSSSAAQYQHPSMVPKQCLCLERPQQRAYLLKTNELANLGNVISSLYYLWFS